jgi:CrcB protein
MNNLAGILAVFIGGGLGSLARYALSQYNPVLSGLPYGTWLANILSCAILGFIIGIYIARPETPLAYRLFWATGFCGGFSTFSTFILETQKLWQAQHIALALANVLGSLLLCYAALYVGMSIGKLLFGN